MCIYGKQSFRAHAYYMFTHTCIYLNFTAPNNIPLKKI